MFMNDLTMEELREELLEDGGFGCGDGGSCGCDCPVCLLCDREIADSNAVRINGVTVCMNCLGTLTLDDLCELTGLAVEDAAACLCD